MSNQVECRYPQIKVQLSGEDGNVFAIIGRVSGALRRAGIPEQERSEFTSKCFSAGSYYEVINICTEFVTVL